MRFLTLVSMLSMPAVALAQSIVFPSDHTNVTNGSTYINWFPFSSQAPFRAQIVYEDWDLGLVPGTAITRIGFRQDGSYASSSYQVVMEILMTTTTVTAETMTTTFDNNYGGTPTVVFPSQMFTLPALTSVNPNQVVWVDLPAPHYTYPGGNLLVEFQIAVNSNGGQSFNYRLDRGTFRSEVIAGVPGCQHSGGQSANLYSSPAKVGGNWNIYLNSATLNMPLALFIAPGQQMTAPYSLSVIGLDPSCQGQLPLSFAAFSASTNSSGAKNWSVPIPNDPSFNDVYMTSQVAYFDFFSPGYLAVSNADQIQFGIDPAASILRDLAAPSPGQTGTVYRNYGVITLFN